VSVFRSGLLGDGGRPRAPPVAGALCTFFFGAALPGAGLGLALLAFAALFAAPTAAQAQTEIWSATLTIGQPVGDEGPEGYCSGSCSARGFKNYGSLDVTTFLFGGATHTVHSLRYGGSSSGSHYLRLEFTPQTADDAVTNLQLQIGANSFDFSDSDDLANVESADGTPLTIVRWDRPDDGSERPWPEPTSGSTVAVKLVDTSTATNNPPTASNNTVTTNEDTAYTFAASDFNFADDDGDTLAGVTITQLESAGDLKLDGTDVTLNQVIAKADIDANRLTFTPAANANGSAYATFRFKVNDGTVDSTSAYTMTIDVTAVNDPPTVANAIPDRMATAGAAFSYTFPANTFADVDDGTLTYTAVEDGQSGLPSWLGFNAGTRTFSGTPAAADVGAVSVKVTASDDDGASVSDTFVITVGAAATIAATLDSAEALFANGALRYRFDLRLSEGVSIPYREMRDHAFSVTNGRMDGAKRIHKERAGGKLYSNHWRMRVAPADETKPVTVTLRGNRPCGEKGALCTGSGVRVGNSPQLTLSTDTEPPDLGSLPSVSIADTSGTEDSANLAFDVRLSKAVSATVAVDFWTVSGGTATADADYREASHRIVFSAGETVQPGSVALIEDAADDAGETVNVEIANARVITPRGAEFGPLPITRGQATGTIDAPATAKTPLADVDMRIENTAGSERGGWLHFTIRLSRALDEHVCYGFETLGTGTATEGVDFLQRPKSTLWQPPGVTEWTEFVRILDDAIDDGGETVNVRISDAELCSDASKTITISRDEATGTIINSDPIPAAWLARLGRTVADQVIGAVEGRMEAARAPGMEVRLAGQRIGGSGARAGQAPAVRTTPEEARGRGTGLAAFDAEGRNRRAPRGRGMTARELLLGSSFSLAAGDGRTGAYALWGRGAVSRFDGREGGLAVDGEVASAFLGADWRRDRTTAGVILGHSTGDGGYRSETGRGTVSSTLTGIYPWMRRALGERISLWGAAGYGEGTLTVTPENAEGGSRGAIRTDLGLAMGAAGVRGMLVQAPEGGGFELSVKTDAMGVRTRSAAVQGLAGASTGVTRLRLGLEGSRAFRYAGGAQLKPSLEAAVRRDGGDAETGFGVDAGGGVAWTDPGRGLSADLRGRGLVSHDSKGFREAGLSGSLSWEPGAGGGRGPSLSLRQTMGAEATGGAVALLERSTLTGLAADDGGADRGLLAGRRLEGRFGYGFRAFGGRFTSTPEVGFVLRQGFGRQVGRSDAGRDYRLGWRLSRGAGAGSLGLSLEAVRRESAGGGGASHGAGMTPEHTLGLRIEARF